MQSVFNWSSGCRYVHTLAMIDSDLLCGVGGLVLIFFTTLPPALVLLAHQTFELRGNIKHGV